MKILVVAEQLEILEYLRTLAVGDTTSFFQYTHPLKAMDNLEEIQPDLVLWSSDDFPRHWKIFLLYARSLFPDNNPRMHLVSDSPLQEEERNKAEALGIEKVHTQGFFNETLFALFPSESASGTTNGSKINSQSMPTIPGGSGTLIVQHPTLHQILIGLLRSADQQSIHSHFPDEGIATLFSANLLIEEAQFRINNVSTRVKLRVVTVEPDGSVYFLILQFL